MSASILYLTHSLVLLNDLVLDLLLVFARWYNILLSLTSCWIRVGCSHPWHLCPPSDLLSSSSSCLVELPIQKILGHFFLWHVCNVANPPQSSPPNNPHYVSLPIKLIDFLISPSSPVLYKPYRSKYSTNSFKYKYFPFFITCMGPGLWSTN